MKRSAIISNKQGVYKLPHQLPNDLRLRILGNNEKSGESLNLLELQTSEKLFNTSQKLLKNSH